MASNKGRFGFGSLKKNPNSDEDAILDVLNFEPAPEISELLKKIQNQDEIILAKDMEIKKIQQDFQDFVTSVRKQHELEISALTKTVAKLTKSVEELQSTQQVSIQSMNSTEIKKTSFDNCPISSKTEPPSKITKNHFILQKNDLLKNLKYRKRFCVWFNKDFHKNESPNVRLLKAFYKMDASLADENLDLLCMGLLCI